MWERIVFYGLYWWKYEWAIIKSKFIKTDTKPDTDITYVAREADKDWIFGAKVRRLSRFSNKKTQTYFHNRLKNLPDSKGYFFVFHQYFYRAIRHNPNILNRKSIIMFTHFNFTFSYSKTHVIWCLKKAHKVICLNSDVQEKLVAYGLPREKTEVIHIASDPDFFYTHERKTGSIGFCSAFGDRKNPDMVFNLVKHLPQREFHLIGRYWERYEKFDALKSMPNFHYHDHRPYEEYPSLYAKIDIFISPSTLEGGPVPVIEAMLSNCVPIATKTGFCPDIIEHGTNGFLFEIHDSYKTVIPLIEQADKLTLDVRATALPYSWENCSKKIDGLFGHFEA